MHPSHFRLLSYFIEIADAGSIRGAARKLRVSAPVVSKGLSDLEEVLQTSLLQRDRRPAKLTADGTALYGRAHELMQSADDLMTRFDPKRSAVSGTATVTLPTELSLTWLPPRLAALEGQYPAVEAEIHASDEVVPLSQSGFDIAVRASFSRDAKGNSADLSPIELALVCAPSLREVGPRSVSAFLASAPFIGFSQRSDSDRLVATDIRSGRKSTYDIVPRFFVNNGFIAKEFARMGYGVALVMRMSVETELRAGTLVEVAPSKSFGHALLSLHFRDRLPSTAARALAEVLRQSVIT